MKKSILYLHVNKYSAKYNDIVKKSLDAANINYTLKSAAYGKYIMVNENDEAKGNMVILAVPFKTATYQDINKYAAAAKRVK